jgi:hypothetical protein
MVNAATEALDAVCGLDITGKPVTVRNVLVDTRMLTLDQACQVVLSTSLVYNMELEAHRRVETDPLGLFTNLSKSGRRQEKRWRSIVLRFLSFLR